MKKYMVFLSIFIWAGTIPLSAQIDDERGILVYFLDSVQRDTLKEKSKIHSKVFHNLLRHFDIDSDIVKPAFKDFEERDTVTFSDDGREIKTGNLAKIFSIKVRGDKKREQVIEELKKLTFVLFAEPNGGAAIDGIPSDNLFGEQWALHNTGQPGGVVDADIDAPEAWDLFQGSVNDKIAVIDFGIDRNHQDLVGKVSGSTLVDWHGTHVAGIAAAKVNNIVNGSPFGVVGVNPNAQLISKAFDAQTNDSYINQIIRESVNEGAQVINSSWHLSDGNNIRQTFSTTVRSAFVYAYNQNKVCVSAAGNTGDPIGGPPENIYQYPAGFGHGMIAVGATYSNDTRWEQSTAQSYVDMAAPGYYVISTYLNNSFAHASGTSMATPMVSGIASLMKGYKTNLSHDDVEMILKLSAEKKGEKPYNQNGWNDEMGYGRVNARAALELLTYPYDFRQLSASGGSDFSVSSAYGITFFGVTGMTDGYYYVKRHEVRKYVVFDNPGATGPTYVWGRGVGTSGWTEDTDLQGNKYCLGQYFCELVPGTEEFASAILRTYVYEVYSNPQLTQFVGWFPTTPANVNFAYSVLSNRPLSVSISGPLEVSPECKSTRYIAVPSRGTGSYTYQWLGGGTGSSKYYSICSCPTPVSVTVTSGSETATASINVYHSDCEIIPKRIANGQLIPDKFDLHQNYPNPFNPSTTIEYAVPKNTHVTIRIYNTLGAEITTLVSEDKPAGYYQIVFDGSRYSSGVYFYRMTAGEFTETKKLILMK